MRSEAEIKKLIIDVAANDHRIRAVLMNGSRVNPGITPDKYQDFDIIYIVNDLRDFTTDHNWVNVCGEIILRQLPDDMVIGEKSADRFAYLMLLEDGNRIDLTLYPAEKVIDNYWPDRLSICLLDKDNRFAFLPPPNDSDHFIKQPSPKEFSDTCNEFWWVSTYVAKGLLRNEITYAKKIFETVVRAMLMKMIEWKIGADNRFSLSFGKAGRFMKKYVPGDYYQSVLQTYADADIENNWNALFNALELFKQTSNEVAIKLNFQIDSKEQENALQLLRRLYDERKH
jgi:aminoglycoside 6-adenylyltransferase